MKGLDELHFVRVASRDATLVKKRMYRSAKQINWNVVPLAA